MLSPGKLDARRYSTGTIDRAAAKHALTPGVTLVLPPQAIPQIRVCPGRYFPIRLLLRFTWPSASKSA